MRPLCTLAGHYTRHYSCNAALLLSKLAAVTQDSPARLCSFLFTMMVMIDMVAVVVVVAVVERKMMMVVVAVVMVVVMVGMVVSCRLR